MEEVKKILGISGIDFSSMPEQSLISAAMESLETLDHNQLKENDEGMDYISGILLQ
jgi:hypothetical protein